MQEKFVNDLSFGEIGEMVTWNILTKQENVRAIMDVRSDKRSQDDDVDFIVQYSNKQVYKIEVKTDRKAHETGNIIYELTSNSNPGCMARSKADYFYYYIPGLNKVYVLNNKGLRDYLDEHFYPEKNMGDGATGIVLPIKDIYYNRKVISWEYDV